MGNPSGLQGPACVQSRGIAVWPEYGPRRFIEASGGRRLRSASPLWNTAPSMTTVNKLRILTNGKVKPAWHAFHAQISEQPGFVVIEVAGGGLYLLLAVNSEQPAAVILYGDSEQSGISSHLFSECPDLTILKLYGTGEAFIANGARMCGRSFPPMPPRSARRCALPSRTRAKMDGRHQSPRLAPRRRRGHG